MDVREKLESHAQVVRERLPKARASEKATEMLLVQPFITDEVLGYSLNEITPQPEVQIAATTVKCDFAISHKGEHAILIECKKAGVPLDKPGQLATYMEKDPAATIGIYTDGVQYRILQHPYCRQHQANGQRTSVVL